MILFECKIEVDSHVVKKNNRPILGRGQRKFIGKSQKLIQAEQYLITTFKHIKDAMKLSTIECDVHLKCVFMFNDYYVANGSRRRLTLPDLSNLIELPQDCLQAAGVLKNDGLVVSLDGSRRLPSDNVHNLLLISLYKVDSL
jgi:Holliday junction resolvase RusA-like endonuclease